MSFLLGLGMMEAGLRLFPAVIPLSLLEHFAPAPRAAVARRRSLPTGADTVEMPRDDGGPPVWLYRSRAEITLNFVEPGIVKTMRMDERGFCNSAAAAAGDAPLDVAALGDSFTWCTNVVPDDAWPSKLSKLTGWRTYNFGVPNRGLYEYLQILAHFALPRAPAVVVMNVYEGNDLRDAVRFHEWRADALSVRDRIACPFDTSAVCRAYRGFQTSWAGRHSYACNLAAAALARPAAARRRREVSFQYQVECADGQRVAFNSRNGDVDEVLFAQRLADGSASLERFDDALQAFVTLAHTHRFLPVISYTPSAYSAYAERAHFDAPDLERVLRSYSERQRRYFAQQAEALGYHFIDMTPALITAAEVSSCDRLLYFRSNVHLTPAGHQVLARELAAFLRPLRADAQR